MSLNFFLLYVTTVFIASIIPGPSMLLALTHGMQFGARRTVASAMGNVMTTLVQASISIAGVGTLLIASETAFQIIKFAGAAYLIYMGIGILISSKSVIEPYDEPLPQAEVSLKKMFLQAAFVTAGNPKAIVFFTAIFPQFINPEAAYLPQLSMLLSIGGIVAFTCFMIYAIGGQKGVVLFADARVGKYINRALGGTFVGVGIGLAASKN